MTSRVGAAEADSLRAVVEPVVAAAGCDLEGLAVTPAGRRRLVRLVVDRDGGVSLNAVAEVSTAVAAALDGSDAMGDSPYVLEVTSPGVDRPLTEPRHWRRAVGRRVRVPLRSGGSVEGRVQATDGDGVLIDVAGESRRLSLADLGAGVVQVEFRQQEQEQEGGSG